MAWMPTIIIAIITIIIMTISMIIMIMFIIAIIIAFRACLVMRTEPLQPAEEDNTSSKVCNGKRAGLQSTAATTESPNPAQHEAGCILQHTMCCGKLPCNEPVRVNQHASVQLCS